MTPGSPRGFAPDLFGQLAATDPIQRRTRRLFGRGRVEAVSGNQADLLVGYDARGNALLLREVPIISGYVPRAGDWVVIQYEGGHAGAPWVAGPSMSQEATGDSAGIGVFPVSRGAPESPQASTVYFDEDLAAWRGYNGSEWVDFTASDHGGLGGLQGGGPGEYYHLTAAEYAGTWGHQLIAISGEQCPLEGVRTTDETAIGQSGALAKAVSSGDMTDGFGSGYAFAIQDNAAVENIIAAIYGIRNGADDTGALLWKTAAAGALTERMRLTATGLGIGCTPAYRLDVVGDINATASVRAGAAFANGFRLPSYGSLVEVGDTVYFMLNRDSGAYTYIGYVVTSGLVYYRVAGTQVALMSTTAFYPYSDNATALGTSALGFSSLYLSDAHAVAPAANGEIVAFATRNSITGRMGDTNVYYAGTVKNVDSALPEFLSQTNLVQTMWSDTVDKDLWVTGKPVNVFAVCRYQLPAYDAGATYDCQVEILLGAKVLAERTIKHSGAAPGSNGYYYVELHSRATKYAGTSLRNIARVKQSTVVAAAAWVEGAKLALTEYAEARASTVTEDVTTANVTLQVRVTFSRSVPGLRCTLMDAGWGPETPVI